MNIFYLDQNPIIAAWYHCDKHVVKMILETAQLLSTAHHHYGSATSEMYKPTHRNHPSAVWVRESRANYMWAWRLFSALCAEYTERYGKTHKTSRLLKALFNRPDGIPTARMTEPPQCMPDEYKGDDTVLAYRSYYRGDKRRFATWKTHEPDWF